MKQRVVTLHWGTAWERYGRECVASFKKHWPDDVELLIITDKRRRIPGARQFILRSVPGYAAFMERWADDRRANGLDSNARKQDAEGKSWKHNAVKWAPQGLAPRHALDGLENGDILAWFDGDVLTTADVPAGWLGGLLGKHDLACLQRPGQAPEIGFWAVRLNAGTRRMIDIFANIYSSGGVFKLPEQHSGFAFAHALSACPDLKIRNLNEAGGRGHVWPHSPLAEFTHHKKGKMKPQ